MLKGGGGVPQIIGSWTPTDNSGASLVFTAVNAGYTQIGNIVFAYFTLTYPSTADGSNTSIAGLPIKVANTNDTAFYTPVFRTSSVVYALLTKNGTTFSIVNANSTPIVNSSLSTQTINGIITYPVS